MRAPVEDGNELAALRARIARLETHNENLRIGLSSRTLIEQAKGVMIERLDLRPEDVFNLLRSASRRSGMKVQTIAAEILKTRATPDYIEREIQHLQKPT